MPKSHQRYPAEYRRRIIFVALGRAAVLSAAVS
jgi:hypothetical protein